MAFMLPEQVESFKTEGEGRFYRFLATVAKPDQLLPRLVHPGPPGQGAGLHPVFGQRRADRLRGQGLGAATRSGKPTRAGSRSTSTASRPPRKNPLQQARDYIGDLKDKIKADGRLVSNDPAHHGNPRIPINHGVVFPNINKFEYVEKNLQHVIPAEKVFFADDLQPGLQTCAATRREAASQKALNERFPPVFRISASCPSDFQHLKQLMFPEVRIELPDRARAWGLYRAGRAPEDPGSQPGGPGAAVRRRAPDHRRRIGERQDAGAGPQGRLSAALQPGHQEHPLCLLQHHPGELRETDPGGQGSAVRRGRA
ncbi:MAG: hypothetical protein MZV65_45445 [Chromatiales bacterium]|nr:hypothetical protein [Chromatiales bacterium]